MICFFLWMMEGWIIEDRLFLEIFDVDVIVWYWILTSELVGEHDRWEGSKKFPRVTCPQFSGAKSPKSFGEVFGGTWYQAPFNACVSWIQKPLQLVRGSRNTVDVKIAMIKVSMVNLKADCSGALWRFTCASEMFCSKEESKLVLIANPCSFTLLCCHVR